MSKKVAIVGAGPAGIAAATTLSKNGLQSIFIDENTKAGGVIYRGPLRTSGEMPHLDEKLKQAISAQKKLLDAHLHNIELRTGTRVQGLIGDGTLLISSDYTPSTVDFDHLILATGCQERSVPFPGGELPGVMLAGGIQLHLKSGLVMPGKKAVLAGTGPLLIQVACQLHRAGVEVAGIYDATVLKEIGRETLALLNRPWMVLDGIRAPSPNTRPPRLGHCAGGGREYSREGSRCALQQELGSGYRQVGMG